MPPVTPCTLYLVIAILCNVWESLGQDSSRRSFLARRAVDGTRGRKYFDPVEEGSLDSYGSDGGRYDPYEDTIDLTDIRENVPGEPGIDYPAYTSLPQTGFTCEGRSRGYYADEATGCQVFHVCHDILVSSFLCPIGSVFSQLLLTCDWWSKVDCSSTGKYLDTNRDSFEESDDDDMIRKAYAMMGIQTEKDVPDVPVDPDRSGRTFYHPTTKGTDKYPIGRTPGVNGFRESYGGYRNQQTNDGQRYQEHQTVHSDGLNGNNNAYQGTIIQDPFYHPPVEYTTRAPPHQDSPIIRIQTIGSNQAYRPHRNRFDDPYRPEEQYKSGFQPSYAPTVPTITTTTRRYYSPTVPTPYKSSTTDYKYYERGFDDSDSQVAQSQDSRSFVTQPTLLRDKNNKRVAEVSGTHHAQVTRDSPGYRGFYNHKQVGSFASGGYGGSIKAEEEDESAETFETDDSIGLGRALNDSPAKLAVQAQDTQENDQLKDADKPREFLRTKTNSSGYSSDEKNGKDVDHEDREIAEPISSETVQGPVDYDYVDKATTVNYETESFVSTFGLRTTPLARNRQNITTLGATPSTATYQATTEAYFETTTNPTYRFNDDESSRRGNVGETFLSLNDKFLPIGSKHVDDHKNESRFEDLGQAQQQGTNEFFKSQSETSGFRINVSDIFLPTVTTNLPHYTTVSSLPEVKNLFENERTIENVPISSSIKNEPPKENNYEGDQTGLSLLNNSSTVSGVSTKTLASPSTTIAPLLTEIIAPYEPFKYDPVEYPNVQSENLPELPAARHEYNLPSVLEYRKNQTESDFSSDYGNNYEFTIRGALQSQSNVALPCPFAIQSGLCGSSFLNANSEVKASSQILPTESTLSSTPERIQSDIRVALSDQNQGTESQRQVPNLSTLFQLTPTETTERNNNVGSLSDTSLLSSLFRIVPPESQGKNSDVGVVGETFTTSSPLESSRSVDTEQSRINSQSNDFRQATGIPGSNNLLQFIRPQSFQENPGAGLSYQISPHETDGAIFEDVNQSRLISSEDSQQGQQQNQSSADKSNDFSVLRSVERTVDFSTASPDSTQDNGNIPNFESLNLLQFMNDLLKTDRVPRPFSFKDSRSVELTTRSIFDFNRPFSASTTASPPENRLRSNDFPDISTRTVIPEARHFPAVSSGFNNGPFSQTISLNYPSHVHQNVTKTNRVAESSTTIPTSPAGNYRPILKEQILDQLTRNFGRPLYQANLDSGLGSSDEPRIPELDRSTRGSVETQTRPYDLVDNYGASSSTTVRVAVPVTEKTVVKTEFVPALGFSLDDVEEREKYAETVLGGFVENAGRTIGEKDSSDEAKNSTSSNVAA